jgi:cytochrome c-type biogenesis protein CcmH/NrfG
MIISAAKSSFSRLPASAVTANQALTANDEIRSGCCEIHQRAPLRTSSLLFAYDGAERMTTGSQRQSQTTVWSSGQAYIIAVLCLLLGLAVGYLLRGTLAATPAEQPVAAAVPAPADSGPLTTPGMGGMPTGQQSADLVDKAAEPMLATLKANPKDTATLTKLGNLYFDAQLYPKAIEYYQRALDLAPSNVDVRTDMGTAYFYNGNPDRAVTEFQKSLSYQPTHAQTLFNMGVVKLNGKHDPQGAIAAWEKLLQTNPGYSERQKVSEMIAAARQQAGQ